MFIIPTKREEKSGKERVRTWISMAEFLLLTKINLKWVRRTRINLADLNWDKSRWGLIFTTTPPPHLCQLIKPPIGGSSFYIGWMRSTCMCNNSLSSRDPAPFPLTFLTLVLLLPIPKIQSTNIVQNSQNTCTKTLI